MSRGGSRNSVVLTKYGERPLIDVPPLSLSKSRADDDVPRHMFKIPGKRETNVYHQPPRSPQVSLTAAQPQQRRYQEPLVDLPTTQYPRPSYSQNRNFYQPQYPVQVRAQPPPPPPPPQPQIQQRGYSNLAPDSNLVPYNYSHYRPQPQPVQPVPQYSTTYAPAPTQQPVPNGTQSNEVHVYYGPNGERLSGPLPAPNYPTDFTLEGTLEYGKLVSVKVRNSNISYREIPDFVFRDLVRMYGTMERTDVKIVAQGGEYNIYASPSTSDGHIANNPGYIYDQQPLRHIPVPAHSHHSHQPQVYDHEGQGIYDPFTKIYRYGPETRRVRRKRYPPVSKRGSSLSDVEEDYFEDSELFTRDTRRWIFYGFYIFNFKSYLETNTVIKRTFIGVWHEEFVNRSGQGKWRMYCLFFCDGDCPPKIHTF